LTNACIVAASAGATPVRCAHGWGIGDVVFQICELLALMQQGLKPVLTINAQANQS